MHVLVDLHSLKPVRTLTPYWCIYTICPSDAIQQHIDCRVREPCCAEGTKQSHSSDTRCCSIAELKLATSFTRHCFSNGFGRRSPECQRKMTESHATMYPHICFQERALSLCLVGKSCMLPLASRTPVVSQVAEHPVLGACGQSCVA